MGAPHFNKNEKCWNKTMTNSSINFSFFDRSSPPVTSYIVHPSRCCVLFLRWHSYNGEVPTAQGRICDQRSKILWCDFNIAYGLLQSFNGQRPWYSPAKINSTCLQMSTHDMWTELSKLSDICSSSFFPYRDSFEINRHRFHLLLCE